MGEKLGGKRRYSDKGTFDGMDGWSDLRALQSRLNS